MNGTRTKILCTLGPGSMASGVLAELDRRGVDLFRINLSHTPVDGIANAITRVRRRSSTPICLDTEGAQVRCGEMADAVSLATGRTVTLRSEGAPGSAESLTLRPRSIFDELAPGSTIDVDFHGASLRVTSVGVGTGAAEAIVVEGGRVGSNKAVTVEPAPRLPSLTEKDLIAIEVGAKLGIRHFALSFTNSAEDLAALRTLTPPDSYIIAKVESRAGIEDVERITEAADAVLIDRGDLSREVPIEHVPLYQKHIIRCANALRTPAFVATNLLESMIENRSPTLAEANDIINTLVDGAHGLVLASETAVGKHPVQSVDMVLRLIQAFEESTAQPRFGERLAIPLSAA